MTVTPYSIFTALLLCNIFIIVIAFVQQCDSFIIRFSLVPFVLLIAAGIFRMIFFIEVPNTFVLGSDTMNCAALVSTNKLSKIEQRFYLVIGYDSHHNQRILPAFLLSALILLSFLAPYKVVIQPRFLSPAESGYEETLTISPGLLLMLNGSPNGNGYNSHSTNKKPLEMICNGFCLLLFIELFLYPIYYLPLSISLSLLLPSKLHPLFHELTDLPFQVSFSPDWQQRLIPSLRAPCGMRLR